MEAKGRWRLLKSTLRLEEALADLGFDVEFEDKKGELLCRCILPSHAGADNHPSFILNRHSLKWHCRSCLGGGKDITSLVTTMHDCDFPAAVDWLCRYTDQKNPQGIAFTNHIKKILAAPRHETIEAKPVLPWFPDSVLTRFRHPTNYYATRGISEEAVQTLCLGFNPEYCRPSGRYTGPAAIIPHIFKGDLVGWQERWVDYKPDWDGPPKYTNTEDFPKSETLYNYDLSADNPSAVVVVESAMTVAKLLTAGIPAVATFGGSVAPRQLRLLKGFRQGLILAYDNDDTGEAATRAVGEATFRFVNVKVLPPPPGEKADLGDLSVAEIHQIMSTVKPYITWRYAA